MAATATLPATAVLESTATAAPVPDYSRLDVPLVQRSVEPAASLKNAVGGSVTLVTGAYQLAFGPAARPGAVLLTRAGSSVATHFSPNALPVRQGRKFGSNFSSSALGRLPLNTSLPLTTAFLPQTAIKYLLDMETSPGIQTELTNWSKSARSSCLVYKVCEAAGIARALADARAQRLSVIPHGSGHSYTDAALNTGGIVIDVTPMRQILSWDPAQGIMRVEPGVTLREMVQVASKDGWWPVVSPSTPEVTIGGCAAMNVNGRNAWKCGPFGGTILAMDVLFATGEVRTLARERDAQLWGAFVGSMGLLGIITSITVQLQRISSGTVTLRRRSATSLDEILTLFAEEEQRSDFMEAWLDGFARGRDLGRGHITCATLDDASDVAPSHFPRPGRLGRLEIPLVSLAASLSRPVLAPVVQLANRANYWRSRLGRTATGQQRALFSYSYWPSAAFAGHQAMFPEGVETFQAFVPRQHAGEIFERVLCYSQQQGCAPIWCIIKQHGCDPFLLSYQVDGFSLELVYQRTHQMMRALEPVLQHMIATVIESGGRFYLAKDHLLTQAQYRRSVGDDVVDTFLRLKQRYDPEALLQSDLFRRVFRPAPQQRE